MGDFRPPRGPEDWDFAAVIVGVPKCGKTSFAVGKLWELQRLPAYVICHDPLSRIPARRFDGLKIPLLRCRNSAELKRAIAKYGTSRVYAVINGDGILPIAKSIGRWSQARRGPPVVLYFDELSTVDWQTSNKVRPDYWETYCQRRAYYLGFLLTAQNVRMVNNQLISLSTSIYAFSLTSKHDRDKLKICGVSDESVDSTANLARYEVRELFAN